jgi:hypothetical protein
VIFRHGWRWFSKGGLLGVWLVTDINWFHIKVGPAHVRIQRHRKLED